MCWLVWQAYSSSLCALSSFSCLADVCMLSKCWFHHRSYMLFWTNVWTGSLRQFPHYSTNHQVAVTHQDIQQCASRGTEEGCKLVNKNVNNVGFKILKNWLWKCFMRFFFCRVTLDVKVLLFVYTETAPGAFLTSWSVWWLFVCSF